MTEIAERHPNGRIKRSLGRPTKLTPERQQKIVTAIQAGNYAETAAAYAGVDNSTFYNWMAKGRDEGRQPYKDFFEAVKAAEAQAEVVAVLHIKQAMPENWAAAMTFLERRFPNRWSRRIEVAGTPGQPVEVTAVRNPALAAFTAEELETMEQIYAQAERRQQLRQTGGEAGRVIEGTAVPSEPDTD